MDAGTNGTVQNQKISGKNLLGLLLLLKRVLNDFGLKLPHYHVLSILQEAPGTTPKKLARELRVLPAVITRVTRYIAVQKLIDKKFGIDQRTRLCYLTKKGQVILDEIDQRFLTLQEEDR